MNDSLHQALREWAQRHRALLVEGVNGQGEPHWTLTPPDIRDDGSIVVFYRPSEHGPLEVCPSNDMGWFERYGTTVETLNETLDLSLADLQSWRGDPMSGLP